MWLSRIFSKRPSVAEWRDAYLDFCKARNVASTQQAKEFAFRLLLSSLEESDPVKSLTKDKAFAFLKHVATARTGGSANDARKRLSTAWDWASAVIAGFPRENPFRDAPRFPTDEKPRYVPPLKDFYTVLSLTSGADYALLLTALHTAARRGELFRLKLDDVDFGRRIIRLGTRKRAGGGLAYDWIPLTSELSRVLS